MIFGAYPCCGAGLQMEMPDEPAMMPEDCPHCGASVWHLLSRVSPQSWTAAEFDRLFTVDHETKTIERRKEEGR